MKREYYIAAAYAEKEPPDLTFSTMAQTSREEFLERAVVNAEPPPEREVVLVLSVTSYRDLKRAKMGEVFGFLFEGDLCIKARNLNPEFLEALDGLLARVLRENANLKHYGLSVWLFVPGGTVAELNAIYGALKKLCKRASDEVDIDFDFIERKDDLGAFLRGALRRIAHGDTMAAYAAASP